MKRHWFKKLGGEGLGNFEFQVDTNQAGTSTDFQFQVPLVLGSNVNGELFWGDGTSDIITAYNDAALLHTYASIGIYDCYFVGRIDGWQFNNGGDCKKFRKVTNWGGFEMSETGTFHGCTRWNEMPTEASPPPLITTTDMLYTFSKCFQLTLFTANNWDVSGVTLMARLFENDGGTSKDAQIDQWQISQVTSFTNICRFTTLTTASYDAILIGWASQIPLNVATGIIDFNDSQYTAGGAAEDARNDLLRNYNGGGTLLAIRDGGPVPAPSNNLLENGSFDIDYLFTNTFTNQRPFPMSEIPGWETSDGTSIEIWRDGETQNNGDPAPGNGIFFIEIVNGDETVTPYNECVGALPGDILTWIAWHRGRTGIDEGSVHIGGPTPADMIATAPLKIMKTSTVEGYNNGTETALAGNLGWIEYTGTYTVPVGQTSTFIGFKYVSSAADPTASNFLDNVQVYK